MFINGYNGKLKILGFESVSGENMVCKIVMGLAVLLAGLELYLNMPFLGMTGVQVAGLLLILYGLLKLGHAAGMCGGCCQKQ